MIHTTKELEEIQKNFIEMEVKSFAREVIEFIDESPSSYHVVKNCSDILDENGFSPFTITRPAIESGLSNHVLKIGPP